MPSTTIADRQKVSLSEQNAPEADATEAPNEELTPQTGEQLPAAPTEREKMVLSFEAQRALANEAIVSTDEDFNAINALKNEAVKAAGLAEINKTRDEQKAIIEKADTFLAIANIIADDDRLARMMEAYDEPQRGNVTNIRNTRGQGKVTTYTSGDRLIQHAMTNGHIPAVATMREGGMVEYGKDENGKPRLFTSLSAAAKAVKTEQDGPTTKNGGDWSINGHTFWTVLADNVGSAS